MALEEEETGAAAWDTDARGAAFLKRFLTRMARQAAAWWLLGSCLMAADTILVNS